MGAYTNEIDFSGKLIIIFGSNATLDAGQKGRFFNGDGSKGKTSLELHDITLKNGKGGDGGAIFALNGAIVEIYTSIFESNTAGYEAQGGGAIHARGGSTDIKIYTSTFQNNSAYRAGGAIRINSVNLKIYDSTFESNKVEIQGGSSGGAIAALYGVHVEIHASSFISNEARHTCCGGSNAGKACTRSSDCPGSTCNCGSGGAIVVNGALAAFNCTFHGNTAPAGGAVYVDDGAYATFTGCIFNGNDGTTGHNDITHHDKESMLIFKA
jgi:hypothetical protein